MIYQKQMEDLTRLMSQQNDSILEDDEFDPNDGVVRGEGKQINIGIAKGKCMKPSQNMNAIQKKLLER